MTPKLPPGSNGTGIEYPTIELGGVVYTVKFTRGGLLYDLSKSGSRISDLRTNKNLATLVDILHAGIFGQYIGSQKDLCELVYEEDKIKLVDEVISEALKKVFPPTSSAAAVAVETKPN